jgi:hypothetical protein
MNQVSSLFHEFMIELIYELNMNRFHFFSVGMLCFFIKFGKIELMSDESIANSVKYRGEFCVTDRNTQFYAIGSMN